MIKNLLLLTVVTIMLFSCGEERKSKPITVLKDLETPETEELIENQQNVATNDDKYIDTKYVYADAEGNQIIVENSLPKGGLKYSAPNGIEYVYAVFWTRITNETENPFELTMNFPEDSYQLPSSPDRFFKLYIPSNTITTEKETQFNYGLDLEKYLDNNFQKQTEVKRTINPNNSSAFYIVTLFNKGVDGTIRTGLNINEQNIFYKINNKEIQCGKINLKTLKLKQ